MLRKSTLALVAPLFALGCDAQTDSDYHGEPLAEMRGNVSLGALSAPPAMDVLLVWGYDRGDGDRMVGQRADLQGGFPASFTLSLSEPPPPLLFELASERGKPDYMADEQLVLLGAIMALPRGAGPGDGLDGGFPAPMALSGEYVVAWVDADLKAGTYAASSVGGALTRGYHLLEVVRADDWAAAHPEEAACFDGFGDYIAPDCTLPDDSLPEAEYDAAWAAYEECSYTSARASGCLVPRPGRDRLRPAAGGFGASVALELVASEDELQGPNLQ